MYMIWFSKGCLICSTSYNVCIFLIFIVNFYRHLIPGYKVQVQFLVIFTLITAIDLCEQQQKYESSLYGLALHEFSIGQWIECPPVVWEVIGLNPVRDSDFFFVPHSLSSSHLFNEPKIYRLPFFHQKRKRLYVLIKSKKITPINTKGIVFLSCEYLGNPFFFP